MSMKKRFLFLIAASFALLLLAGCVMPDVPQEQPPEGSLTFDEMIADLDALQGPQARSLTAPGGAGFSLYGSASLSLRDLSAFINAVKNDFAAYVKASAGGSTYIVTSSKLSLPGSNSGLMWVPFTWGVRKSFPIISLQHGTQVYRDSVPSRFNANPLSVFTSPDQSGALQSYVECMIGGLMASAGYIVVMPDYPGLGDSPAVHPYVQMALGDAVKDAVVTARALLAGKTVRANEKVYLTGYSEGGYATMAGASALAAASIAVNATVPGDGPYDLSQVMRDQMISQLPAKVPWYLLYTASGYKTAYPGQIDLNTLLVPDCAALLSTDNPFDGSNTTAQIAALPQITQVPRNMLTAQGLLDLADGGSVNTLLLANGYMGWVPTVPLIMIHCPADDVVPYQNAANVRDYFVNILHIPAQYVQVVDVPPVPLLDSLLGSIHAAAFPTAMLAAFTAIQTVNH
jgi:pimeloyl-ACP methyl ester carboxylesterase